MGSGSSGQFIQLIPPIRFVAIHCGIDHGLVDDSPTSIMLLLHIVSQPSGIKNKHKTTINIHNLQQSPNMVTTCHNIKTFNKLTLSKQRLQIVRSLLTKQALSMTIGSLSIPRRAPSHAETETCGARRRSYAPCVGLWNDSGNLGHEGKTIHP